MTVTPVTRVLAALTVAVTAAFAAGDVARAESTAAEEIWRDLKFNLYGDEAIADGADMMTLETPYRAHDAALVPFEFTAAPGVEFESVDIIIDENPAPLAATFTFGPAAVSHSFSARFRVNAYSHVRAVGRAPDGQLYMVANFVKASGGCSAPASKDPDKAKALMGQMKLREFDRPPEAPAAEGSPQVREAQIMIRHPNYSGLQMNQLTRHYIPAHFMDRIDIVQGGDLLMRIEGGISLSEDPNIRFHYSADNGDQISVEAHDTEDQTFRDGWLLDAGA